MAKIKTANKIELISDISFTEYGTTFTFSRTPGEGGTLSVNKDNETDSEGNVTTPGINESLYLSKAQVDVLAHFFAGRAMKYAYSVRDQINKEINGETAKAETW